MYKREKPSINTRCQHTCCECDNRGAGGGVSCKRRPFIKIVVVVVFWVNMHSEVRRMKAYPSPVYGYRTGRQSGRIWVNDGLCNLCTLYTVCAD